MDILLNIDMHVNTSSQTIHDIFCQLLPVQTLINITNTAHINWNTVRISY